MLSANRRKKVEGQNCMNGIKGLSSGTVTRETSSFGPRTRHLCTHLANEEEENGRTLWKEEKLKETEYAGSNFLPQRDAQ
jgi:hypothetical protein